MASRIKIGKPVHTISIKVLCDVFDATGLAAAR